MSVEVEEIALFGLFTLGGRTIQIREEHFKKLDLIVPELTPIPIDYQKLYRLGFIRFANGVQFRQKGEIQFFLRLLKDGRWEFYLNDGPRIRIVHYIHQIQRLWFDLFEDHLFIPKSTEMKNSLTDKPKSGKFQKRH